MLMCTDMRSNVIIREGKHKHCNRGRLWNSIRTQYCNRKNRAVSCNKITPTGECNFVEGRKLHSLRSVSTLQDICGDKNDRKVSKMRESRSTRSSVTRGRDEKVVNRKRHST